MGSCISKCRPKKKFKEDSCIEDFSHVHDKVVISQAPISSIHKPVSPSPSVASSTTSFSSVSGGVNCNTTSTEFSVASSLSSSSSCSSSVSISKDRSFSNEFLWSCVKENPQIIGRNVIKGSLEKSSCGMSNYKVHQNKFDFPALEKPTLVPMKQAIQDSHGGVTPKKRARANSPTLVRQKSFRKEPDKVMMSSNTYHLPNKTMMMRSPSPSRRFNGESLRDSSMNATKEIYSRRSSAVPKANSQNSMSCSSLRKEHFRTAPSPNYDLSKKSTMLKIRDALITQKIGLRNGEIRVGEKEANQDLEGFIAEDIHNPLIALDCFIFL